MNTLLKALGLPEDIHFKGDKNMSRRDLFAWMTKVNEQLASREGEQAQYVKNAMAQLENALYSLSR